MLLISKMCVQKLQKQAKQTNKTVPKQKQSMLNGQKAPNRSSHS